MAKATKKSDTLSALAFLSEPSSHEIAPICAVVGDEAFLKREVLGELRRQVLAGDENDFSLTTFTGKEAQLREVLDALATVTLFGDGRRLVIIDDADSFVTQYRSELEDYVERPAKGGVLVLEVKLWPGNTRLAKAVAASGLTIECRSHESWKPQERKTREKEIKTWLTSVAKSNHEAKLAPVAADALLELIPPEPGILAQEIAKLALLADEKRTIEAELVRENVGGWRVRAAWDMIDAAADGNAGEALAQLDRLIASGEKPHGLLAQMSATLRRFATAVALVDAAETRRQKLPLRNALSQAGVHSFKLNDAERQLRQLSRARASQLTRWLLASDLAMKGYNSADDAARIELERLIVRLANTKTFEAAAKPAAHR